MPTVPQYLPISDIELFAELVRLRRAANIYPDGKHGAIPTDREAMVRLLKRWVGLVDGAIWSADGLLGLNHFEVVGVQIDDVLARVGVERPGTRREQREIRALVPRLRLTEVPFGWLRVVHRLAKDLDGHGTLHSVGYDGWSRLRIEAELDDWTGARAVAFARIDARRTCQLCGQRGAIPRLNSWAHGVSVLCSRHEP